MKDKKTHPKDLPFDKDVDLEFEYKVFLILDKISKYKYFIIGFIAAIIVVTVIFFFYKQEKEAVINEASKIVYKIKLAYENDNDEKALSLIEDFKKKFADTPFIKVVLAYEQSIKKSKNPLETEKTNSEVKSKLVTDQLKSGYKEYSAFLFHEKKQDDQALGILGSIDDKYYNSISAKLLTAIILKEQGDTENAKAILQELSQKKMFRYFSTVANENL